MRLRAFGIGSLLLLSLSATSLQAAVPGKAAKPPVQKEMAKRAEAPVLFDGKPLFFLRERVMSFTPEERAQTVAGKLTRLAEDPLVNPDAIRVVEAESTSEIVWEDKVLMSITDRDAAVEGIPRSEMAEKYAGIIRAAVKNHIEEYSLRKLLLGALFAALATAVLVGVLLVFRGVFQWIYALLDSWKGTRIRAIRVQSVEILPEEVVAGGIKVTIRWIRVLATAALFYFYIPLVLSFFPWTRKISVLLLGYVLSPVKYVANGIVDFLPNMFFIAVIAIATHYLLRFLRFLFREVEKGALKIPGFYTDWAVPTFKIVRFMVITFALVVAYPYLPGSESPAFKGVSIFFGVLFSLGSTSAIANIVSGISITYMRAFKIGDRVQVGDTVGEVIEKTLLVTRLRTIKNVDVTIPNSMVLGAHVVNYSARVEDEGLILHTDVTIGYDIPWRDVYELLIAAARKTENIMSVPAPFVLQTSLDNFYVCYQLNAYTRSPQSMARTYSELHQNIQDGFNEAGIEIMSPHYARIRDGNAAAIPGGYLPAGYEPPAFRLQKVCDGKGGGETAEATG